MPIIPARLSARRRFLAISSTVLPSLAPACAPGVGVAVVVDVAPGLPGGGTLGANAETTPGETRKPRGKPQSSTGASVGGGSLGLTPIGSGAANIARATS